MQLNVEGASKKVFKKKKKYICQNPGKSNAYGEERHVSTVTPGTDTGPFPRANPRLLESNQPTFVEGPTLPPTQ